MTDHRIPVWGILAILASVVALAVSGGNLLYTAIFSIIFIPALWLRKRADLSSGLEKGLSFLALCPLVFEQLFTENLLLHSIAHSLLLMSAVKVYKKKAKREIYIVYFTNFAIMILAASTTQSNFFAIPLIIYFICIAFSIRLTIFRTPKKSRIGNPPHVFGALLGTFVLAGMIAVSLSWLQENLELTLADFLGEQVSIYSAFSGRSKFGDVGEMKTNNKVVLRIYADKAVRLIGKIFVRYTSEGWRSDSTKSREILPDVWARKSPYRPMFSEEDGSYFSLVPYQKYLGKSLINMKIIMGTQTHRSLFTPYYTIGVQCFLPSIYSDRHGAIYRKASLEGIEYLAYHVPVKTEKHLKGSGVLVPGVIPNREEGLTIPDNLLQELVLLSGKIVGDETDPSRKARKLRIALSGRCEYTTSLDAKPGVDPVHYFLFERKKGNCEMFGSALALLLRAQGIPSRYVTGFQMKGRNYLANYFIVRERDAHAWTEAFIKGSGWLPFDATPPDMEGMRRTVWGSGFLRDGADFLKMKLQEIAIKTKTLDFKNLMSWLWDQFKQVVNYMREHVSKLLVPLLISIFVMALFIRFHRMASGKHKTAVSGESKVEKELYPIVKKGSPQLEQIRSLFREFEDLVREDGLERNNTQTLQEFITDLESRELNNLFVEYGKQLINGYHQCRYGTGQIDETRLDSMREQWKQLCDSTR